jgi:hypothetical protein
MPYALVPVPFPLRLLSRLLIVWQPLNLAIGAIAALNAWTVRGGTGLAAVLVARAAATAVGVAAGLALSNRQGHAVALAKAAVVMSAGADLFVYATPYMPSNRAPGDTIYYAAASLAIHGAWLVYLFSSRQVRELSE